MEFHSNYGEDSKAQKTSKANVRLSSGAKQRNKLGSILNFEHCERTYGDFHPQMLNYAEKSGGFPQKQQVERKREELVMYMSCLPGYLERGENPQEKPFNIGVLDWCLLQKWQHTNSDVSTEHSPSTSNSTSISSKGSSSYCSSENAWSHHQQKTKYPSPPTEDCLRGTKNGGAFIDCKNDSINLSKVHQSSLQVPQCSGLGTVNSVADRKSEDRDLRKVNGTRTRPLKRNGIISGLDGNDVIYNGEASKADEQVLTSAVADLDFLGRFKTAVPESRNDPASRHIAGRHDSDSARGDNNGLLDENYAERACHAKLKSDHTRFCSIACECGKNKDSQVEKSFAKEARNLNCPSDMEQKMRFIGSASVSPLRRKNLEKMNSGSVPRNLSENDKFQMKVGVSESSKVRNPSPTRRFSFAMGRIGKSSNSNSSSTANLVSDKIPDSKVTSTSACSTADKSNATSRARTSPLRRLLDPILKPRGVHCHDVTRSSVKHPSKTDSRQVESPAVKTSDKNGFRADNMGGPHRTQKNGPSSMQALLQVAVKNDLPLFTFTVDKCSDIFAATVKEFRSNKTMQPGWIYTFFSFSDLKKKNNGHWINQGSKDKNHGYTPNIVAQMNVSDILCTDSAGKCPSNSCKREFVLTSVVDGDTNQTSDSNPGNELAAIVVKFPEKMSIQRGDNAGNETASGDSFSTTVILPGGHHGVPSKGEPSPLIERWKSGGMCDCGGWDLGCRLRTLANSNEPYQQTKSQPSAFKLFSQDEAEERRPMFTLSPFEDGIYSVEFNSSLKLVQAFSVGLAVLHCRTMAAPSPYMYGGKMCEEAFNKAQIEVCAKYATNPPLSPVGRV